MLCCDNEFVMKVFIHLRLCALDIYFLLTTKRRNIICKDNVYLILNSCTISKTVYLPIVLCLLPYYIYKKPTTYGLVYVVHLIC